MLRMGHGEERGRFDANALADPAKALGLEEGDAHVIRNAGGRTSEAIRSLAISQQLLGTREIVIVHHVRYPRTPSSLAFLFRFAHKKIPLPPFLYLSLPTLSGTTADA